jgi:hypothetical protein
MATDVTAAKPAAGGSDALGAAMGEQEEVDEDDLIDGFPIDCGTKERKFLSMQKCIAVTSARHPHMVIEATMDDDQEYVQPYELHRDTGQHNLECGGCHDVKRQYGCIRPLGFMQHYGIGMSLYFKFVKTLNTAFGFAALVAVIPCSYYWNTSGWSTRQKGLYLNNPATEQKYQFFFTSAGSLMGSTYVCGMGYEDERFELACPVGVMVRVEAYYGDP